MNRDSSGIRASGSLDTQAIWQQVHDGLRAFIARRVANEAEADDILQEVFLRMHRKLDSVKDPRRLTAWVYQITRHAIIDHYRASAGKRETAAGLAADLEAASPAAAPSFEDAGRLHRELAGCLRPMIERLSPDYRQAVTLVELDGLTQQAAAKQMKLSVSGMKSRVQRGRRQLRAMLDDCCAIELDRRRGVADYRVRDAGDNPCGSCQS